MSTSKEFTPEQFTQLWNDYVQWAEDNPLFKYELNQRAGEVIAIPCRRAINLQRFYVWVKEKTGKCIAQYFDNPDNRYAEYISITSHIRDFRTADNIEGGMSGLYNANLTARINSIKEQTDVTSNSEKIDSISVTIVKPNEDGN
jgi:hypothetical protein